MEFKITITANSLPVMQELLKEATKKVEQIDTEAQEKSLTRNYVNKNKESVLKISKTVSGSNENETLFN